MTGTAVLDVAPSTTSATAQIEGEGDIQFAVFSGENPAAIHLLETVKLTASPPTLQTNGDMIGYQLSIPVSSKGESSGRHRWFIGAGAPPALEKTCIEPEIRLGPPGDSPGVRQVRKAIHDLHAILYFHPNSGALLLMTRSRKPIMYEEGGADSSNLEISSQGNTLTVLWKRTNYLNFGSYRFAVHFVARGKDKDRFNQRFNMNLNCHYHALPPSDLLNFIPSLKPSIRWNISLHRRIQNSLIVSGIDVRTGQPVAVKGLKNNPKTRQYIMDRLQIAHQIRDELPEGILDVIDIWCEHGASPPCFLEEKRKASKCQMLYYSMPLAEHGFDNMPWDGVKPDSRSLYFYQSLLGLSEIHQKGITHGHISPRSLLILTETERRVSAHDACRHKKAVISLSMRQSKKHNEGLCIPPEAVGRRNGLDGAKADIWALAVSWLSALAGPQGNTNITENLYANLLRTLDKLGEEDLVEGPLVALIRKMLDWEPQNRPSAIDALNHEAWKPVLEQKQVMEEDRKRKRIDLMQHHKNKKSQKKKVGLLSPER
ncbi:hypothetical protein ACHAQJ_007355 [Trichoderma viride]